MIYPRHAQIRSAAEEGHVLDVLGKHERTGFKYENASAAGGVGDEEMFRHDGAKSAAADDDYVEVAPSSGNGLRGTIGRFLQRVAEEATHVVERERRRFSA